MNDKERLDWFEETQLSLINDDSGLWAVCGDGFQNVPIDPPCDIQTTFFIEKEQWCKSVRGAIDKAIERVKAEIIEDKENNK